MSDVALNCESRFKKKRSKLWLKNPNYGRVESYNDYTIFIWYKILFELLLN